MSINSAEQGLPAMAGRVLLIDNSTKHTERVRDLVSRTRLEVYTVSSAQDAIRQMLIHTFDVIALHTAVEGAVPLCTFLLDLRHARNTLLLLYPIPTAEARTYYYRRGLDLCLPEDDPVECAAAIEALLRRPWAGAWDADQRPPALVVHRDLVIDPLRRRVTMRGRDIDLTLRNTGCSTSLPAIRVSCSRKIISMPGCGARTGPTARAASSTSSAPCGRNLA